LFSTHKGFVHSYFEDTYAENSVDRSTYSRTEIVEDITNIRSLNNMYEMLREEHDIDLQEYRVVIEEEKIPKPEDIDTLIGIFKSVDATTAICFNCVSQTNKYINMYSNCSDN
jgi:hypothetical protein